jgi:hypothetical protein
MEELYNRIINVLTINNRIPLSNGNFYWYVGRASTRINGQVFPLAFEYEISQTNHKRVTIELIHSIYQRFQQTGIMPTRAEMFLIFPFELCSRPCNYTVAVFIVKQLIIDNNSTQP